MIRDIQKPEGVLRVLKIDVVVVFNSSKCPLMRVKLLYHGSHFFSFSCLCLYAARTRWIQYFVKTSVFQRKDALEPLFKSTVDVD